jgi:hypothetical protein
VAGIIDGPPLLSQPQERDKKGTSTWTGVVIESSLSSSCDISALILLTHILEIKVERHVAPVTFYNVVVDFHFSRMADQDEEEFYLKGYKIDREKLPNNFPTRPDDPKNVRFRSLWQQFPTEFLYLANGKEPEGGICLVFVLADGYNKEKLEQEPVVDLTYDPYTEAFTPGIWVEDD